MVTAIWGWSFVAKQQAMHGIHPSAMNACVFILGALALLPFAWRELRRLSGRDWLSGLFAGTVLFIAFAFQTSGLKYTTPSNAGFITGMCVVLTPILLFLIARERPSAPQMVGCLLAVIGLGMLSLSDFTVHAGDALVFGCAIFFALHIVVLSRTTFSGSSMLLTFIQLVTVGVLSLVWSLGAGEFSVPAGGGSLGTLVAIALAGTALAFYIQTRAQSVLPAQKVALLLVCEPVFSGIFGYLLAGDRFTTVNLVGAGLILAGMIGSELRFEGRQAAAGA